MFLLVIIGAKIQKKRGNKPQLNIFNAELLHKRARNGFKRTVRGKTDGFGQKYEAYGFSPLNLQ